MKLFMNIPEVLVSHMGVNLGSGDIGMAKHGLNGAKVSAITK